MHREPTVTGRKLGLNDLEHKKEINIQPEQNEEIRKLKKLRRGLGTSRTTLNIPTSES